MGVVASMTRAMTSTSASAARARSLVRSPRVVRGRCRPGVSRRTSWLVGVSRTPRTVVRVVWGRSETMVTLVPTSRLTRVDLPALGRPTIDANPERNSGMSARGGGVRDAGPVRGRRVVGGRGVADQPRDDASALDAFGAELEVLEGDHFAFVGDVAQQVEDEAADGVPFGVGELDAELFADLVDGGPSGDAEGPVGESFDAGGLAVVLVDDLADDLLEEVFEGAEPGGAAVLVDDDRHVELFALHLAEELGDAFLLGDEHRGA